MKEQKRKGVQVCRLKPVHKPLRQPVPDIDNFQILCALCYAKEPGGMAGEHVFWIVWKLGSIRTAQGHLKKYVCASSK